MTKIDYTKRSVQEVCTDRGGDENRFPVTVQTHTCAVDEWMFCDYAYTFAIPLHPQPPPFACAKISSSMAGSIDHSADASDIIHQRGL